MNLKYKKSYLTKTIQEQIKFLLKNVENLQDYAEREIEFYPSWYKDIEEKVSTIQDLYVQIALINNLEDECRTKDEFYDAKIFFDEMSIRSQNPHAPDWDDLSEKEKLWYKEKEIKEQQKKWKEAGARADKKLKEKK